LVRVPAVVSYSPLLSSHAISPSALYTLSLHDALPIWRTALLPSPESLPGPSGPPGRRMHTPRHTGPAATGDRPRAKPWPGMTRRSEEHTSELQSRFDLVCRLLLEKKKKNMQSNQPLQT